MFVVSAIVSVLTWASLEAELSTPPKIIPAIVSVLSWASLEFGVSTPPAGAGGVLPGAGGAFDSEKEKEKGGVKKTERLNNVS